MSTNGDSDTEDTKIDLPVVFFKKNFLSGLNAFISKNRKKNIKLVQDSHHFSRNTVKPQIQLMLTVT